MNDPPPPQVTIRQHETTKQQKTIGISRDVICLHTMDVLTENQPSLPSLSFYGECLLLLLWKCLVHGACDLT